MTVGASFVQWDRGVIFINFEENLSLGPKDQNHGQIQIRHPRKPPGAIKKLFKTQIRLEIVYLEL